METTIKRKITLGQMELIFDIINIRLFQPINKKKVFDKKELVLFSIHIRHNEDEKAIDVFNEALKFVENPFSLNVAKTIWEKLGDVPVNKDDELDEDFIISGFDTVFEKGTDNTEVWHWFEETFNISVAKDLMFN